MVREFAIELVRGAGQILRDGLQAEREIDYKGTFDLVTNIDRASESFILAAIRSQFPDHAILAEESGADPRQSRYTWVIDPVDGTTNYAHGLPYFSVTIALLDAGEPVLGVTYDPIADALFVGERGRGASRNTVPLRVSAVPVLLRSLVSTGFPYDFATNPENNTPEFVRIHRRVQGVRRMGSAALDLALVAAGQMEAHWERRLNIWDAAAGVVLVREAGGTVTDWSGAEWQPGATTLLATNGHIHEEILAVLNTDE